MKIVFLRDVYDHAEGDEAELPDVEAKVLVASGLAKVAPVTLQIDDIETVIACNN